MRVHPVGALLGWGLYLLGILILSLGLTLAGIAMLRTKTLPNWVRLVPLITAAAALASPFAARQVGTDL